MPLVSKATAFRLLPSWLAERIVDSATSGRRRTPAAASCSAACATDDGTVGTSAEPRCSKNGISRDNSTDDNPKWPTVSLARPVTARPPHCGSRKRRIRIRCARGNRLKKDSSSASSAAASIQDKAKCSVTMPDTLCTETTLSVVYHVAKCDGSDCRPNNEEPLSSCPFNKVNATKPLTVSSSSSIEAKALKDSMTIVKPLTVSSYCPNDAKCSTVTSSLIDSKPLAVSTPSSPTSATRLTVSPTTSTGAKSVIALPSLINAKLLPCRDGNSSYPLLNAASTPMFESVLDESLVGFLSIRFNDLRVSSRAFAGRSSSLNPRSSSCFVEGNFPTRVEMCLQQQNDTPMQTKPLTCNGSPSRPSAFLGRVDLWKESFESS